MAKKQSAPAGELAERLKWAMERAGYETLTDLARDLGLSLGAVHQWSNGSTEFIRPIYLFPAARLLRVEPEWLGTGVGPKTRLERAAPDIDRDICQLVDALPQDAKRSLLELLRSMWRRR